MLASIIYPAIVSGCLFSISLWQISWEFPCNPPRVPLHSVRRCPTSSLELECQPANQVNHAFTENIISGLFLLFRGRIKLDRQMHLITVHCLTLTNFPGLLLTWPALTITGSWLAVSVSLTAPRGAGLSSLPGAPLPHIMAIPRTPHWPVTTHSQAGKNNNHRKLAFPCLSNLQEKSF